MQLFDRSAVAADFSCNPPQYDLDANGNRVEVQDSFGGTEVTGTLSDDDGFNSMTTANDSWALGTNAVWTLTSSSSSATDTETDTLTDNFSGGSSLAGSVKVPCKKR